MIERYLDPRVELVFGRPRDLARWAAVERAVLRAQATERLIPNSWALVADDRPPPRLDLFVEAERRTRHEVEAFIESWGLKHVHVGLTSSDVTDTAMALALRDAFKAVTSRHNALIGTLDVLIQEQGGAERQGRTHGVAATRGTWTHRLMELRNLVSRRYAAAKQACELAQVAKIAGPIGDHSHPAVSLAVESHVAEILGLSPAGHSTQIVNRDRLAQFAQTMALLATGCEQIATQIRLGVLVGEVTFEQPEGYVGSSAMPGKVNPIQAEQVSGMARLSRASADAIREGMVTWFDRDLTQTSSERVAVADLFHATCRAMYATNQALASITLVPAPEHPADRTAHYRATTDAQIAGYDRDRARAVIPSH